MNFELNQIGKNIAEKEMWNMQSKTKQGHLCIWTWKSYLNDCESNYIQKKMEACVRKWAKRFAGIENANQTKIRKKTNYKIQHNITSQRVMSPIIIITANRKKQTSNRMWCRSTGLLDSHALLTTDIESRCWCVFSWSLNVLNTTVVFLC